VTGREADGYVEHGGSWRPLWLVAAAMAVFLLLDLLLPGGDVPPLMWFVAVITVLGIVAAGCRSARRMWTVRVDDRELAVGLERVALSDIDVERLRAIESGADAGAEVLGGGWSLPRGRTGLPLRLDGGRSVLVPTRDPAALRAALLAALSSRRGTLDP
jgi:hypothetical protein